MKTINIVFEGSLLPQYAYNIDLASNLLDNVPEGTKSWFFHFTVCAGVNKEEQTPHVIEHSRVLLCAITQSAFSLKRSLCEKYGNSTAETMLASWQVTLKEMIRLSENKRQVHWTGELVKQTTPP